MYRPGQYTFTPEMLATLGYGAAGTIESIGDSVNEFAVGDEANVIPAFSFADYDMYGELVVVPVRALVRQPGGMSSVEAAGIWMQFVAAYGALIDIGKLQKGDTVLIRAASSSVGLAALQIAKYHWRCSGRPQRVRCLANMHQMARQAAPGTSCIPTGQATKRWLIRLMFPCCSKPL